MKRKLEDIVKPSRACDKKINKIYKEIVSDSKESLKEDKQQLLEWKEKLNQAKRENNTEMIEFYQWCIEEIEEWVERDKERIKSFS